MQKRIIEGVEVQRSSGNVFADLGLPDAEKLKIKTGLVVEIRRAMRALGLTQQAAAKRMGIPQPKVSGMMRGDFTNLSERKLMDGLAAFLFLLQGKPQLIIQIIKAHRDFDRSKHQFQQSQNPIPIAQLKGALNASLVFGYFLQGKKTWTAWSRNQQVH